ncbi:hypothetical protein LZ554_004379 [Drepanopeziza brunnea f. sp. 'monogermtubi']|nr:hypothetical protein LZ554_004379 [Drepanopeziza brunnea f. sp. 'monogermtubi']
MYSSVPSPPPPQWNQGSVPNLERITSAASPSLAAPISPTGRTGRLRGLSYLRSYTQNHILSRDSHHSQNHSNPPNQSSSSSSSNANPPQRPETLGRSTSYPASTSMSRDSAGSPTPAPAPTAAAAPPQQQAVSSSSPSAQRTPSDIPFARLSNSESPLGSTSGWLPTVGGQSAVSRIATEPQSTATGSSSAVLSGSNPSGLTSDLTASMARTRTADFSASPTYTPPAENGGEQVELPLAADANENNARGMAHQLPSIRFSAHQDPRAQRPSLLFSPMARILPTGKETIKVGRYSERDSHPTQAANVPSSAPVGFKSKVVSRRHCEFWCSGGRWFIKDVKSSSGTFLNHIRLSSPGNESKPFPVNDGDIVQLGIDFKGGEEMIFRCVKIRVELNKGWQNGPSSFNVQAHKRLRELNNAPKSTAGGSSQDCSICLGPIAPCQSLFVAPCSHTWHYKCIRVIINGPMWPHFTCPNCRDVSDLEAELEDPYANADWEPAEADDADATSELPPPVEPAPAVQEPSNRLAMLSEDTGILVEAEDHSEPDRSSHSDVDIAEGSDSSGADQVVHRGVEGMGYLNIEESPSPSQDSDPDHAVSNATVPPVNIARKAVGNNGHDRSHLRPARTPSPTSGSGAEGPMTPRNDIGPFVFDGSAGRSAGGRVAELANLGGVSNTPPSA